MCDIRLGSTKAIFGETFVNLGILSGDGGAWFLQRVLNYQIAAELALTGRLVKAEEAKELGLLLNVFDPKDLISEAQALAETIAKKPPQASRYTKRLLKTAQRTELRDFLNLCALMQGVCHNTEDHLRAVNSFLNKTPTDYLGR